MPSSHRFFVTLTITDQETFASEVGDTAADILAVMISPPVDPGSAGFEVIEAKWVEKMDGVRIEVAALVDDPERLFAAARNAYLKCWSDDRWQPGSPEEALYELLLASNMNPSPDVMGFAFEDWGPLAQNPSHPSPNEDLTP